MQTINMHIREKALHDLAITREEEAAEQARYFADVKEVNRVSFIKKLNSIGVALPEETTLDPTDDLMIDGLRFRFVGGDRSQHSSPPQYLALVGACQKCQQEVPVHINSLANPSLGHAIEVIEKQEFPYHHCPPAPDPEQTTYQWRPSKEERLALALVDLLESRGFKTVP